MEKMELKESFVFWLEQMETEYPSEMYQVIG